MKADRHEDWLRVVYGGGREGPRPHRGGGTNVAVRLAPAEPDPMTAPGGEQRVRVTVIPSEPRLSWSLYLQDFGAGAGEATPPRVWWRVDPGTWQPLGEPRQCVAVGRGRIRVDVELRADPSGGESVGTPRLRFLAESD